MSFTQIVKQEICGSGRFEKSCCAVSQLYGMLLFASVFQSDKVKLTVESVDAAKRLSLLAARLLNAQTDLQVSENLDDRLYTVTAQAEDARKLYFAMGHEKDEISLRVNRGMFECEQCPAAFISGAFLAAGSVLLPDKAYRCEIVSPKAKRLSELRLLMQEEGIETLSTHRKASSVLYIKASENIEDFLSMIGAPNAAFDIMNVKIYKDFRNRANRAANCETANIIKNVEAAAAHLAAIQKLKDKGKFEKLSPELKEAANLRTDNPEYSLAELAKLTDPPVSKSGFANRMKKLMTLAEELP